MRRRIPIGIGTSSLIDEPRTGRDLDKIVFNDLLGSAGDGCTAPVRARDILPEDTHGRVQ